MRRAESIHTILAGTASLRSVVRFGAELVRIVYETSISNACRDTAVIRRRFVRYAFRTRARLFHGSNSSGDREAGPAFDRIGVRHYRGNVPPASGSSFG